MTRFIPLLIKHRAGSTAAEFALVLPLLLVLLLGTIDVGRFIWAWNQAEKATQMGVRFAVVTDPIPAAMKTYSYSVSGGIVQGNAVPAGSFGGISCASTGGTVSCTCKTAGACPFSLTATASSFTDIVHRMSVFKPDITADNVTVDYSWSGLGYAGDPNGPDIAPMVTVGLRNMQFMPTTFLLIAALPLPSFRSTLSMEDGDGTASN